ncbi:L-arabinose isomerase [Alicyclobacillus acidiphilus]|uniref:L-arabinose isomerase n=1 Tax=Alicyclobacillus acidiphilus TaxID=182455 RepID=UPI00351DD87B
MSSKESQSQFWFVAGSQHLYGQETLRQVEDQTVAMVRALGETAHLPYPVTFKTVVSTPEQIRHLCLEANQDDTCAGVICWMHTFSPAKMWIAGLKELRKPMLHLHTQYNRDIPWSTIDMDFMNLNQSAHGDREFGFIGSRMNVRRKVIVGHWSDQRIHRRIGDWMHTAAGVAECKRLKVARFGDNMREVAVTEGDKVEAQIKFGWSINGYGIGDLADVLATVTDAQTHALLDTYEQLYVISPETRNDTAAWNAIREQARMEIAMRTFLEDGNFGAFTTTFEDLHGLKQLPGLAVQRLMADGFGFGGEGDWKTAALTRVMKVMAGFQETSFMEDYTYHLDPDNPMVLGAHMLEVCPTIAAHRPRIEVHPLSIGGKEPPARLIFDGKSGPAVVATMVDLGHRFRLIVNEVEAVQPTESMPKLPVARVLWRPQPSLSESAEAWIYAGGAHHTVMSYRVSVEQMIDFADMMGIECIVIRNGKSVQSIRDELRWNEIMWR